MERAFDIALPSSLHHRSVPKSRICHLVVDDFDVHELRSGSRLAPARCEEFGVDIAVSGAAAAFRGDLPGRERPVHCERLPALDSYSIEEFWRLRSRCKPVDQMAARRPLMEYSRPEKLQRCFGDLVEHRPAQNTSKIELGGSCWRKAIAI